MKFGSAASADPVEGNTPAKVIEAASVLDKEEGWQTVGALSVP
jgi:hypothetical protein